MRKNKLFNIAVLLLFVLIGAAAFPIVNFSKSYPLSLTVLTLFSPIVLYFELGCYEKAWLQLKNLLPAFFLNLAMVLFSLVCRYLLEFGEISNSYNFTFPNIIVHVLAALLFSCIGWLVTARK